MWNYCSLDRDALVKVSGPPLDRLSSCIPVLLPHPGELRGTQFTFDLMDKDKGGTLSVDEVHELVSMIHGSRHPDGATAKVGSPRTAAPRGGHANRCARGPASR